MQSTTLDLSADVIDVRDIIARFEELDSHLVYHPFDYDKALDAARDEHYRLLLILEELKGYGGDEQWRGDWYPVTLIRDSYFTEHMRELLADCGDLPRNIPHYIEIDWDATARNIQVDYSSVDVDGLTYWYR